MNNKHRFKFENNLIMTDKTIQFIEKAEKIHGERYDYSKVVYENRLMNVIIGCEIHGNFEQTPRNHLRKTKGEGRGCLKCSELKHGSSRRKTTEKFVEEAKELNKDRYDYSKVEYSTNGIKVTITCKEHGDFLQSPADHLSGKHCSKCSGVYKPSTFEFIEKCTEIHGEGTYDYSDVNYINAHTKVIITCPKEDHGKFLQTPDSHYRAGCPKCGNESVSTIRTTKSREEFIKKATACHMDIFDYSKVDYVSAKTPVIIICRKGHGEFLQTPDCHFHGSGCPKCSGTYRRNNDDFIQEAKKIHGENTYDYSQVDFTGTMDSVTIICPNESHGPFEQGAGSHLANHGCPKCAGVGLSNTEEFVQKAVAKHGNKYDYSKVDYINSKTNVTIICKVIGHGEFLQKPTVHYRSGCPSCVWKTEGKLYEKILEIYPETERQFKQDWCKKINHLPFDFCIKELKIIIELDGPQHFKQISNWSSPEEQFENDQYKQACAAENGYSIIRLLQEDVLYDNYDWFTELCCVIDDIQKSDVIVNKYMCQNNEYSMFDTVEN
jgi:very-short-patch-repair endonuclease/predicted nucleic-acid-binding Zn-ribbon protein